MYVQYAIQLRKQHFDEHPSAGQESKICVMTYEASKGFWTAVWNGSFGLATYTWTCLLDKASCLYLSKKYFLVVVFGL